MGESQAARCAGARRTLPRPRPVTELRPHVNLIGYVSSNKGLGQIARGYRLALEKTDTPLSVCDLSDMVEARLPGPEARSRRGGAMLHPAGEINLIVTNPMEVALAERRLGDACLASGYNIGAWWWELKGAPPSGWKLRASMFDELWAGSTFVQKTFQEHFSLPVFLVPPLVQLATSGHLTRAHFGLPDDVFIFFFTCDFNSVPERKNPLAVIEAFKIAFSLSDNARLLLKVSNTHAWPDYRRRLEDAARTAGNITLFDGETSKDELDALMQLCDCYVSLHRSEGFGLTIAEALLAGKPVVATGWSGNMDFMSDENSWPVPYELVEIKEDYGPYIRGHFWASPDVEAAAQHMRTIFSNRQEALARAARGQQTIRRLYSLEALTSSLLPNLERLAPVGAFVARLDRQRRSAQALKPSVQAAPASLEAPSGTAPKVSVCLPVFNGETYLVEAIESVLSQTHEDFELLIADDQSADSSYEIAKDYARRDKRIRCWQNQRRLGLFANYNQCIRLAHGKFIKPFAQDDALGRTMLATAVEVMERHPSVSLFSGGRIFINEHGVEHTPAYLEELFRVALPTGVVLPGEEVIRTCLFPIVNRIGEPCAVMFPRRLAGEGFDESFHHVGDLEMWVRLLLAGTYYGNPVPLCKFRLHSASATSSNIASLLFATDTLKMGSKHEALFARLGLSKEEFIDTAVDGIAAEISKMSEVSFQVGTSEIKRALPQVSPEDFRQLAFYALRRAARGVPIADAHTCPTVSAHGQAIRLGEQIVALEAEIREMLASPSWRLTKPLRDLNRALSASKFRDSDAVCDTPLSIGDDQTEYLIYLTMLKFAITQSRSWTITGPLRKYGAL